MHLVCLSPFQFTSGRISAISKCVNNFSYGLPPLVRLLCPLVRCTDVAFAIGCFGREPIRPSLFPAGSRRTTRDPRLCLSAVLDEILESSRRGMIGPNHGSKTIEGPSPPVLKSHGIKIRLKHAPACFNQFVNSRSERHTSHSHCASLFARQAATLTDCRLAPARQTAESGSNGRADLVWNVPRRPLMQPACHNTHPPGGVLMRRNIDTLVIVWKFRMEMQRGVYVPDKQTLTTLSRTY